jgi:hypothetical protein
MIPYMVIIIPYNDSIMVIHGDNITALSFNGSRCSRLAASPVLRVRVDGDQLQGASLVHVALVDLLKLLFEDLELGAGEYLGVDDVGDWALRGMT